MALTLDIHRSQQLETGAGAAGHTGLFYIQQQVVIEAAQYSIVCTNLLNRLRGLHLGIKVQTGVRMGEWVQYRF